MFPELALTTFFPRWYVKDLTHADHWYETEMPGPATQPLFDRAKELGIGFCLGYAELATDPDGTVVGWAWTFGNAATGTGATTSTTYAAAGTYTSV